MKNIGLISSFILLIVSIFLISITSLFFVSLRGTKDMAKKHGKEDTYIMFNLVEDLFLNDIKGGELSSIKKYLLIVNKTNKFDFIDIHSGDKLIATTRKIIVDPIYDYSDQSIYIKDLGGNIYVYARANNQEYFSNLSRIIYSLLGFYVIIGIVLGISSYIYLNHFIAKPVKKLVVAISNADSMNISHILEGNYPREISAFSTMFSKMIRDINEKKSALEDYSSLLEFKVQSRTWELEKTIEDLKSTKSVLFHQEKMASIGLLAAGVAHEINNPAGYVRTNIEVMTQYLGLFKLFIENSVDYCTNNNQEALNQVNRILQDEDMDFLLKDSQDLLLESIDGIKRISKIVMGLKEYSREDKDELVLEDINSAIDKALNISWNNLKYKATVTKNLGELPKTYCYLDKLTQVLVNLLMNGAQAINEKGEIIIDTWCDAGNIFIRVADTGEGMDNEVKKNIFDPFYTTKSIGVGTGLGLSISQGIIEKHGGRIDVESSVGKGSVFTITLPIIRSQNET